METRLSYRLSNDEGPFFKEPSQEDAIITATILAGVPRFETLSSQWGRSGEMAITIDSAVALANAHSTRGTLTSEAVGEVSLI